MRSVNVRCIAQIGAIFLFSTALSGCVAAVPLALAAVGSGVVGYGVYRTYSGAEVSVDDLNDERAPDAQAAFAAAESIAIWPSEFRHTTVLAQELESGREFGRVIPPSSGSQMSHADEIDLALSTRSEVISALTRYASDTNADLVVATIVDTSLRYEAEWFTFGRTTNRRRIHCIVIVADTGRVVWEADLEIAVSSGTQMAPEAEVQDVIGRALSDRLRNVALGTPLPQSGS